MASIILGIMGKKRAGKDTFAARLVEKHGFTRISLADPLRAMAKALDPIVDFTDSWSPEIRLTDVLGPEDDWEVAKELPEVRYVLQRLGTEAVRGVLGNDVWVEALAASAEEVDGPVVVPDVRFPDEADFIQARGSLVRVVRPGPESTDTHASETALDARVANYIVRNADGIEDLQRFADGVARDVLAYV